MAMRPSTRRRRCDLDVNVSDPLTDTCVHAPAQAVVRLQPAFGFVLSLRRNHSRRADERSTDRPAADRGRGDAYLGIAVDALDLGRGGARLEIHLVVSSSEPQR